jgi:hypothetical protein
LLAFEAQATKISTQQLTFPTLKFHYHFSQLSSSAIKAWLRIELVTRLRVLSVAFAPF